MRNALDRLVTRLGLGGDFYVDVVRRLVERGALATDMRVLVVCGGEHDRAALLACGFRDVTISNVDERMVGSEFAPFAWSFQDAEALDCPDASFDLVIAHNGLHHCASPHRAVCEMYRVARSSILVFEPYDGLLTRLALRTGLGQRYEVAAVVDNDMRFGGVRNTAIPNFVYRWTEAEVRKLVMSLDPVGRQAIGFFYATRPPLARLRMLRSRAALALTMLALPLLKLVTLAVPKAANNFAFHVAKPRLPSDLQPWLTMEDGRVVMDRRWVDARYARRS